MSGTGKRWPSNEPRRLRVYDLALHLADQVHKVFKAARCELSLKDQARRCADSVVLNIAEGSAYTSAGMKIRHYEIARASAAECIGCLDLLRRRDAHAFTSPARRTAEMVSRMLHSLIQKWQSRR